MAALGTRRQFAAHLGWVLLSALLIAACTDGSDRTADDERAPTESAATEPAPTVQVPADTADCPRINAVSLDNQRISSFAPGLSAGSPGTSTLAPTVEASTESAGPASQPLPDPAASTEVEPAPLGTFVVARPDAGIRRAAAGGEPSPLEIPVYESPFCPPGVLLDVNEIDELDLPVSLFNWSDDEGVLVLRVIAGGPEDDWLQVQAPARPNGSYVWVRRHDFDFGFTDMRIEIDLAGEGELVLYDGDDIVLRSGIVQGQDSRPTPTHVTFVERGVRGASLAPAYGTAVLSMASFSEVLGTFGGGGLPSNFIHGTNRPDLMGQRLSSGEIRLPNDVLDEIIETITPGTPVLLFDSGDPQNDRQAILGRALQPAATISFAEGSPGAVDATSGVTPHLWQRCPQADELICRRVLDEPGLYPYLVVKPDAGEFDEEVGRNVIPVYDVPHGEARVLVHEPPDNGDPPSLMPLRVAGRQDAPLVLWPIESTPDNRWFRVVVPTRPEHRTVWVSGDDFELRSTDYRIEIDLAADGAGDLSVYDGNRLVTYTDRIVSGRETRPTTLGQSYIDQVLDGAALSPAYGEHILSYPLFSDVLATFGGGLLPNQAIHGTNQPELTGQRVSSGNIRLDGEVLASLVDLPGGILGARVIVFDGTGTSRQAAIRAQTGHAWLPAPTTAVDDTSLPLGTPLF